MWIYALIVLEHIPYIIINQLLFSGVAQGVVTGIRGLCNGLGPALFGLIFYLFHVDLNEATDIDDKLNIKAHIKSNQTPEVRPGLTTKDVSESFSPIPDQDFRCFYPCEIFLSHIPLPALGKDKKLTAAR